MSQLILDAQQSGKIIALSPQVEFDWKVPDAPERGELAVPRKPGLGLKFDEAALRKYAA